MNNQQLDSVANLIDMGDTAMFDETFKAYYAPLCHFAEKSVGRRADAEDIVQALFTRLWSKQEVFESAAHARAFLYRATYNGCLDFRKHHLRTQKREAEVQLEGQLYEGNYLDELVKNEVWAEIYRAVQQLPSQCANVIRMSYFEGLKNDEIAEKLGVSVQAVKNTKHRGVEKLKEMLSQKHFLLLLLFMS